VHSNAEKKTKIRMKMISKNLKIERKSGFFKVFFEGSIGFWAKNEGR